MLADRKIKSRSKLYKRMTKAQNKRFLRKAAQYSTPANVIKNNTPARPVAISAVLPKILFGNKVL